MAVVTTGFHRVSNVQQLVSLGITLQAVPYAQILVSLTSTGAVATIYSDPALSVPITGATVTADKYGNYDYYIPLNYSVTETITFLNNSYTRTISNICSNGPLVTTLTTTANTSDTVTLTGVLSTSHVFLQPTNSSAATMLTSTYVSSVSAGSFVVTHPNTSGATFDIMVTPY